MQDPTWAQLPSPFFLLPQKKETKKGGFEPIAPRVQRSSTLLGKARLGYMALISVRRFYLFG
jgi:hypothetical protein